jgi:hypothetical protein
VVKGAIFKIIKNPFFFLLKFDFSILHLGRDLENVVFMRDKKEMK